MTDTAVQNAGDRTENRTPNTADEAGKASEKLGAEARQSAPAAEAAKVTDQKPAAAAVSTSVAEQYQAAVRLLHLAKPNIQEAIGRNGMALDTPGNSSGRSEFGTYKVMSEFLRKSGLANAGWNVVQTEKNSPLDHMNVDYVLFNGKTGQMFFLDVTSNKDSQQKINHPFVTMIESKPSLFDPKTAQLDMKNPEADSFLEKTAGTLRALTEGKTLNGEAAKPAFWFALPKVTAPVAKEQMFPLPIGWQARSANEFEQETRKVVDWLAANYEKAPARQRIDFADWMLSIEQGFNKWKEIKWKSPERTNLVPDKVRNEFRPDYKGSGRFNRNAGRFGAAAILIPSIWEVINPRTAEAAGSPEAW